MDPNEQNLRPSFTNPFNLTVLPAICVPCGFPDENLPSGVQIASPPFDEATVFASATLMNRQHRGIGDGQLWSIRTNHNGMGFRPRLARARNDG